MLAATRTHRDTALLVLATLGGAAWLALPLGRALRGTASAGTILTIAAVLGSAIGAAATVTAVPRLALVTAAVGGAVAVALVRGLLATGGVLVGGVGLDDLASAAAAAVAAAAATALMRRRTWPTLRTTLAALISFGVVSTAWFASLTRYADRGQPAHAYLWLAVALLAPVAGGALTARLVRDSVPGHVALGWLGVIATASVAVAIADRSPLLLGPGFVSVLILGPILSALGLMGHWLMGRTRPAPAEPDLAPARVRR